MHRNSALSSNLIVIIVPLAMVITLVLLVNTALFSQHPSVLSVGITIDLVLSVPLVYFLLVRNRNIPNLTTIPVFVVGIVVASLVLPPSNQELLGMVKTWILPLVEIGVVLFIVSKGRAVVKRLKTEVGKNPDIFSTLREVAGEILPERLAYAMATEMGVFYYGFLSWKRIELGQNEFTYHRKSGTIALLSILLVMILVEMTAIHFLLRQWSYLAAWILTGLSVYTGVQVYGMARSLTRRPYVIQKHSLLLRYGIMGEAMVELSNIASFEFSGKPTDASENALSLSPLAALEKHNVILHLKDQGTVRGLYGSKRKYSTLAFFVDDKTRFGASLSKQILAGQGEG